MDKTNGKFAQDVKNVEPAQQADSDENFTFFPQGAVKSQDIVCFIEKISTYVIATYTSLREIGKRSAKDSVFLTSMGASLGNIASEIRGVKSLLRSVYNTDVEIARFQEVVSKQLECLRVENVGMRLEIQTLSSEVRGLKVAVGTRNLPDPKMYPKYSPNMFIDGMCGVANIGGMQAEAHKFRETLVANAEYFNSCRSEVAGEDAGR